MKLTRTIHTRRSGRPSALLALALSVGLAAGGLAAAAPPASAAGRWTTTPVPDRAGSDGGELNAVSCPSVTSCFAVGTWGDVAVSKDKALAEHWNGHQWSSMTTPNPADETFRTMLFGISCPSTTSCFAVGYYFATDSTFKTLVEHWNGHSWSITASPNPVGSTFATLNGVSCPSTQSCFAVGASGSGPNSRSLVEHWNGSSWAVMLSPNPSDFVSLALTDVSCPSTKSCFAAGYYFTTSADKSVVEHWNGHSWGLMAGLNPNAARNTRMSALSCPSAKSCVAVGQYESGSSRTTLVARWNGRSWRVAGGANHAGSTFTELIGLSCPTTTSCFAVGDSGSGSTFRTLVEHWNGSHWAIMATPNPAGATTADLLDVSCQSTTSCFAVGAYTHRPAGHALAERYS